MRPYTRVSLVSYLMGHFWYQFSTTSVLDIYWNESGRESVSVEMRSHQTTLDQYVAVVKERRTSRVVIDDYLTIASLILYKWIRCAMCRSWSLIRSSVQRVNFNPTTRDCRRFCHVPICHHDTTVGWSPDGWPTCSRFVMNRTLRLSCLAPLSWGFFCVSAGCVCIFLSYFLFAIRALSCLPIRRCVMSHHGDYFQIVPVFTKSPLPLAPDDDTTRSFR